MNRVEPSHQSQRPAEGRLNGDSSPRRVSTRCLAQAFAAATSVCIGVGAAAQPAGARLPHSYDNNRCMAPGSDYWAAAGQKGYFASWVSNSAYAKRSCTASHGGPGYQCITVRRGVSKNLGASWSWTILAHNHWWYCDGSTTPGGTVWSRWNSGGFGAPHTEAGTRLDLQLDHANHRTSAWSDHS